jgi:hypothetical protein
MSDAHNNPGAVTLLERPLGLEREVTTFKNRLGEFLPAHEGEFVLIHGTDILGFYPTWEEALDAGYERIGPPLFLIKEVVALEPTYRLSRGD